MLERKGIVVVSANTDGVEVLNKSDKYTTDQIVQEWGKRAGMEIDVAQYYMTYNRDVNNYIAIYPVKGQKGTFYAKTKGIYTYRPPLPNKPVYGVVFKAIELLLTKEIESCKEHIDNCTDMFDFINIAQTKAGAVYDGEELGKVVRFYYAKGCEDKYIAMKKSGNRVAKTLGSKPIMDIDPNDPLPDDLNYEHYYQLCKEHCLDLGVVLDDDLKIERLIGYKYESGSWF